ncbi:MAG: sigma-E processing peptidase SpoIIGA [Lachnospiraceae bacterium]
MQTVYIELILLDNFLMDFIILFFSVRLSERRVKIWRIILSALLGGIYSITAVLFYSLRSMMLKILVSLILVALAEFKNQVLFLIDSTFYGYAPRRSCASL